MRTAARLAALALVLSGCGYSTGLKLAPSQSSYGVEIFSRDGDAAPVRNIEREMAIALTRATVTLVDADIEKPSEARVVFRGRITSYSTAGGVRSPQNTLLEQLLSIVVVAELFDRQTQEIVAGPVTVSARSGSIVDHVTLFGQEAREDAEQRILKNMAERIVLELITKNLDRAEREESPVPAAEASATGRDAIPAVAQDP